MLNLQFFHEKPLQVRMDVLQDFLDGRPIERRHEIVNVAVDFHVARVEEGVVFEVRIDRRLEKI